MAKMLILTLLPFLMVGKGEADCFGCGTEEYESSGGSSWLNAETLNIDIDKYLYIFYAIAGVLVASEILGTLVICCCMDTTKPPPCWAKFCFPLITIAMFDCRFTSCFMVQMFGCWYTMCCWDPPQSRLPVVVQQKRRPVVVQNMHRHPKVVAHRPQPLLNQTQMVPLGKSVLPSPKNYSIANGGIAVGRVVKPRISHLESYPLREQLEVFYSIHKGLKTPDNEARLLNFERRIENGMKVDVMRNVNSLLFNKYGADLNTGAVLRDRLFTFYSKHKPAMVPKIDTVVDKIHELYLHNYVQVRGIAADGQAVMIRDLNKELFKKYGACLVPEKICPSTQV